LSKSKRKFAFLGTPFFDFVKNPNKYAKYADTDIPIPIDTIVNGGSIVKVSHKDSNGDTIIFRSTWEAAFAVYLEAKKINYNFEPCTFLYLDGSRYTPDFYLPDLNIWVEVKGFMKKSHIEKMARFASHYALLVVDKTAYQRLNLASFRKKSKKLSRNLNNID
jgi:hypothetical protein